MSAKAIDEDGLDSALVRLESVARTYGTGQSAVVAVRDATGSVPARARLAVTGPSGSGKSTLLQLMSGLDRPTVGTVSWPALAHRHLTPTRSIAMVFQGPSLIPALNVEENVALPLVLAGQTGRDAHAAARSALALVDLTDLSDKLPEELSGGQSQRVAVARVLASRPRLILADEPTGHLDAVRGAHVIDVLLAAADQLQAALVISTHDPAVADRMTSRWRMSEGSIRTAQETVRL